MSVRLLPDEQVVALFGDPEPYVNPDGTITAAWDLSILDVARMPKPLPLSWNGSIRVDHVRCHKKLVSLVEAAFDEIDALDWSLLTDFGGCYNWRTQRRAHVLSRHCWGIALDLNVRDNPMGGFPKMPQPVIDAFARQGFAWGGDFEPPRIDGMHFEFSDAARLLVGPGIAA